jgi:hypothetical protein
MVHNHPSGDPTPSHADIQMTKAIVEVAKPLGIAMHDHIMVGKDGHASLKGLKLRCQLLDQTERDMLSPVPSAFVPYPPRDKMKAARCAVGSSGNTICSSAAPRQDCKPDKQVPLGVEN